MKTWKLTLAYLAAVSILSGGSAWSRPVDLSAPSGEVGAANSKGYLEIWREIEGAGINFGPGSYLPLRYKFSSDDSTGGILGPGFYLPMFEARNALIREQVMRAFLPCGKGLYFWKDTVDPTKFQTVDKEWTGALSGNGDFSAWRDDSWTIFYHQGRLTSITTDEHHVFTWDYDGNTHMATGISEDGKSLVTVEPNQQGLVDALVFDSKRYEFGYSERPLIEMVLGQIAIKQLAIALSSFKYPDGKTETFHFELTPERVPTVTFTSPDQKQTLYTWDAATDHIATEQGPNGNWTYKIGQITQDFGLPPITRTSSDGKSEEMTVDNKIGTYTSQAADGVITVTHVFETPGPLYHKVHKIELVESTKNGQIRSQVYRASYDEAGKLIREIDENGWITTLTYDEKGLLKNKIIGATQDSETLLELNSKKSDLINNIKQAHTRFSKNAALEQLAYFYMTKMRDIPDAMSLVAEIADRDIAFNISFNAICDDSSASSRAKLNELRNLINKFPEKKEFIMTFLK